MAELSPINLKRWIDEHRHLLKPPVGNAQVWADRDTIVMIVAGPNGRKDFHVNPTEEMFYQLEGDIVVTLMENGKRREVKLGGGDMFLLPPNVPHSPQRPAGTVGMVIERLRPDGALDALRWYCERCDHLLHEARFQMQDITTQIKQAIEAFFGDAKLRACKKCGAVMSPPQAAA